MILGHSEAPSHHGWNRRSGGEEAAHAALRDGLTPIVVGVSCSPSARADKTARSDRAADRPPRGNSVRTRQKSTVVAYEPVWAIRHRQDRHPEQTRDAPPRRAPLGRRWWGTGVGAAVQVLYGGSVNAGNAATLFAGGRHRRASVAGASPSEAAGFWKDRRENGRLDGARDAFRGPERGAEPAIRFPGWAVDGNPPPDRLDCSPVCCTTSGVAILRNPEVGMYGVVLAFSPSGVSRPDRRDPDPVRQRRWTRRWRLRWRHADRLRRSRRDGLHHEGDDLPRRHLLRDLVGSGRPDRQAVRVEAARASCREAARRTAATQSVSLRRRKVALPRPPALRLRPARRDRRSPSEQRRSSLGTEKSVPGWWNW